MNKINRIKKLSVAKLFAFIFGIFGLIAGVLYSFAGLFLDVFVTLNLLTTTETTGLSIGTLMAFGALFVMPVIGYIIGFIMGYFGAILYNLFSKYFGGIDLDFE